MHGFVSHDNKLAHDTLATRRHLDVGAHVSTFGTTRRVVPTFVKPSHVPSGFSTDVKLHSTGGLEYTAHDGARWGGRASIGQSRFQ